MGNVTIVILWAFKNQCCGSGSGGPVINWSPRSGYLIWIWIWIQILTVHQRFKEILGKKFNQFYNIFTTDFDLTTKFSKKDPDPDQERSVINWLPRSKSVIQDCGSGTPDPKQIFADPHH
jgi:hypothetical protein